MELMQHAAVIVNGTWPWYVVRAAGFVAAGLLILQMLWGIGQVTGLTYKLVEPIKAWAIHKAIAYALCGAIAVHVGLLLVDGFLPFSLTQAFIPFVSHYSNHTTLLGVGLSSVAIALGVLAMYGIAIIVASSLGWIETKSSRWRKLHYLSYFVMLAVFVHALGAGSDLKYGAFREVWILAIVVVALGVITRLWRAGTLRKNSEK
jgi:hypothetical protein